LRSLILVVATGFCLAIGGLVYFWMQPAHGRRGMATHIASTKPVTIDQNQSGNAAGPGKDVWLKKYDQRTGDLASEFHANEYTPQRGGRVAVNGATARFYMYNAQPRTLSQVLQIQGETGLFTSNDAGQNSKKKPDQDPRGQTPTRGQLHDVVVTILDADESPMMTITMNNAAFDSERSVIETQAYTDESGTLVPEDQVKVEIRSSPQNPNGYDFDGRGLKISWNERDHRLSRLEVAHGERLVIKNPRMITQPKGVGVKQEPRVAEAVEGTPADDRVILAADKQGPASDDDGARPPRGRAARAAAATTPARGRLMPNTDPPIYRATFSQDVRIVQNDVTAATCDRMLVDFWMKSDDQSSAAGPTTQPAAATTQPTTRSLASTRPTTVPTTRGALAAGPTTAPSESPVYIYWTGPLVVVPQPGASVATGESVVTLEGDSGNPVIARQQTGEIRASRLVYRTEDGSLHGSPTAGGSVVMTASDGHGDSIIHTAALEYLSRATPPVAILSGKSTADLPTQANGPKMHAAWIDRCRLTFEQLADGRSAIREADLSGNVKIDHPQLKLNSQRLELTFDTTAHPAPKPATQPISTLATQPSTRPAAPLAQTNLKQLVASDAVHCEMTNSQNQTQTLDGDRLTLLTEAAADGRLLPRTVNVDGSVHAVDPDQDLRAGHVAVTLVPSTRPASTQPSTQPSDAFAANVDLQSLLAHDSVHVIGRKDDTEAFADTMLVDKKNGQTTVKLVGQPFAKIIQKGSTITGPVIDLSPDDQQLAVDGGGTMHGAQQDAGAAAVSPTTRPIDVAWTRSLRVDGKRNVVDALGDVVAKTIDADGTVNTIQGARAQLLLVDAPPPATQPTTRPAAIAAATTKPTTQESAVARKAVRQARFHEDAVVTSTLLDNDGLPLRRMKLKADTVQYDLVPPPLGSPDGAAPTKKLTVPGEGKMLVEDYRPPSTQPAAAKDDGNAMASARGATAFQWSKSLVYDDSTHKAVMDGSVIIDHRDDVAKEDSMRLTGDTATAELEPLAAGATTNPATTKPTEPRYQVRKVTATGHLLVTMKGGELIADSLVYDPVTRILIARGSDRSDAVFTRAQVGPGGTQPIRAQEMQWDAKSDLPKITRVSAQLRK
jgi:lipopolysaccharide export system protein LptA